MATPLSFPRIFFVPMLKDPKTKEYLLQVLDQIYPKRKSPSGSYQAGIVVNLEERLDSAIGACLVPPDKLDFSLCVDS